MGAPATAGAGGAWATPRPSCRPAPRPGECVGILGSPLPIVLAGSVRVASERPRLLGGIAYLWGWLRAAVTRRPRVEDRPFRDFVRREQYGRVRAALRRG